MYSECRTFEELCNQVNKVDFYELRNLQWIKNIIIRVNQLGFFTFTSQPGSIFHNIYMYKSVWHRIQHRTHNNADDIICSTDTNYISRKQRAYIRGYMRKDMANYIIESLKNDPYLIARSVDHNTKSSFDDGCEFGSVIFVNDKPVQLIDSDERDLKLLKDADWSFALGIPLHRPLTLFKDMWSNLDEEYFDGSITEFDIVDKRWNNNDHLWTTLLQLMESYHN